MTVISTLSVIRAMAWLCWGASLLCLVSCPAVAVADARHSIDFETETVTASANKKYDYLRIALPSGQRSNVGIFYEDGGGEDRFARIIPDPVNKENHVLQFWLKNARVKGQRQGFYKGRVQMNLADINLTEAYQRCRVYLHPDLEGYRSYPNENGWFTINELWFGAHWKGADAPFRISLNIGKEKGVGKSLYFLASGSMRQNNKWVDVWGHINKEFEILIGEWLDMEVGYKQGDKNTGRFYMAVKRAGDATMTTILDVHDWTYSPRARAPVPLTHWNPLKIYTSSAVIDHIRDNGGIAQIYWDDLEIMDHWPRGADEKGQ